MTHLSPEAQCDFWTALTWVRDHHDLTYYSLAARNGDCEFPGGTIRHVFSGMNPSIARTTRTSSWCVCTSLWVKRCGRSAMI